MESPRVLCEVDFEVPNLDDFGRYAVQWVGGGVRELAADLLAQAAEYRPPSVGGKADGPVPTAGMKWGWVTVVRKGKNGLRQTGKDVSEDALVRAEKSVAKGAAGLNCEFFQLGEDGLPEASLMRFEANMVERVDGWCHVRIQAPESVLRDGAVRRRWVEFLRRFCDSVNPSYGQISYDYGPRNVTALEAVTGPPWTISTEAIAASRVVLRGYDWLTMVADELADQLGGVEGLRASGAFAQVERLRAGGVWLLATEDYADYVGERVEAVWRVLAPVLLKGTPSREHADRSDYPYRLVFRDAADVSGRA